MATYPRFSFNNSNHKFNIKDYVTNKVTEDEVRSIKQSFDLFDIDRSGSIDIKQLKASFISFGLETAMSSVFLMIPDLDTESSNVIYFQEWLNLMTMTVDDKNSRININKIFAVFDDERTGFISIKNLRRVAKQLGENVTEQQLQELITRADLDQDNLVSEQDFYEIVTRNINY